MPITEAIDTALPSGVIKVIHQYSAEYPDDPRIKRTTHVMDDGEEKVVFEARESRTTEAGFVVVSSGDGN
jgi:phosphosulfolactate synthase (CoM biosynthesis protein A)